MLASLRRYTILQNNELSIIAAHSFSEIERNSPAIGAFVVIIDKKNGGFRMFHRPIGSFGRLVTVR
jgi:hypothetical protein